MIENINSSGRIYTGCLKIVISDFKSCKIFIFCPRTFVNPFLNDISF